MALSRAARAACARQGGAAAWAAAAAWAESVGTGLAARIHILGAGPAAATAYQPAAGLRALAGAAAAPGSRVGGAAAAALRRPFSSGPLESLRGAAQRVQQVAASSAEAVRAAGDAVSRAGGSMYRALPASARQLIAATQTPGATNRVASLQLTAFWQNHGNLVVAAGGAAACYALWHALCGTAELFVELGQRDAAALLALSAAAVGGALLHLRRRHAIDPQAAYRLAVYRLNTHPGLLEVMGAPLVGSPVRASVLTGGGLSFKGLRPRLHSKRLQMIFPLKGSERRGLVSLEAKKRRGQLRLVLLAVDVPSVAGGEQRVFLEGGPALYARGGVLDVLRDPFIRALSMEGAFTAEDEAEEAAEAQERAAAAAQRAAAAAAKRPQPLDQGGGMYLHERLALAARRALARLRGGRPASAAQQQPEAVPPEPAARAA